MVEDKLRVLLPSSAITDELDNIINAFVMYYGEDKREEITKKFRSILILKFSNLEKLKEAVNDIKVSLLKEIYGVEDSTYVHLNADEFVDAMKTGNCKYLYISDTLSEIIIGKKKVKPEEIYELYKSGKLPKLEEFIKRYESIKERLKPYEEKMKIEMDKKTKISDKYYRILYEEFKYLFSDKDIESFEKYGFIAGSISHYISSTINKNGHCFDEESEKKLNDPNTKDWIKKSIITDRTFFLASLFPLKDRKNDPLNPPPYEEFLSIPECREFIKKTIEVCTKISKRQSELYDQMIIEQVENLEDYKECRRIIDSRGFVNKNDSLGPYTYNAPISCYEDNYVKTDSGYVLSPLLLINSGSTDLDCTVIHELNHAYEQATVSVDEKGCSSTTGWDYESIEFKDKKDNQSAQYTGISRGYELMSEYVNDRIAQEITDIYHNNGSYMFTPKRGRNTSAYLVVRFLLEDFFMTFKDIIIKSRSHGNQNYIFEMLGKDNFDALNGLVREFYDEYGFSFGAQSALADYYQHVHNERTIQIESLIQRKNVIMENMKERLMSQGVTL